MRTTPVRTATLCASAALTIASIVCIFTGYHLIGNILGAAAGTNFTAGLLLKKY